MTILVTGATGNVSSALIQALDPLLQVRALVRKPVALEGVDTIVGDLEQPSTLGDAFAGVDTLWLLLPMGPQSTHASSNAVWAARQAGVKHIVRLSAIGAAHDAPTRNGRLHALSDVEVQASGIPWTIIRPAFFTQNLYAQVNDGVLYSATGDGKLSPIDVRDIAAFGASVLRSPAEHTGKIYTITGPASVSLREAAPALGASYQPIAPADAVAGSLAAGFPQWISEVIGEYTEAYSRGWADYVTPDFEAVVGRPARDLATSLTS